MKNMSQATENLNAPPPGRRLSTITAAEATTSNKSGASMLVLSLVISDGSPFDGAESTDYLITDGTAKGAGMARKKMRAIGTNLINQAIDSDAEIPDSAIAQELVGLQLFVDYGNEQMKSKDQAGEYTVPMTTTDANGKVVPLNKLTVVGYSRSGGSVQTAQAPVQQAPAQFLPQQGFAPQQTQQYAPPAGQQQFAPQQFQQPVQQGFAPPQQGWPVQGGAAPQQFAQAPQGYAPQPAFGQVAQPVWNGGEAPKAGKKAKGAPAEG